MKLSVLVAAALVANLPTVFVISKAVQEVDVVGDLLDLSEHHHGRRRHHSRHHKLDTAAVTATETPGATALYTGVGDVESTSNTSHSLSRGRLQVAGPLPMDFEALFSEAVAKAVACTPAEVQVLDSQALPGQQLVVVDFMAPSDAVHAIEDQAADPYSKLAQGALRQFLMAPDSDGPAAPVSAVAIGAPAGGAAGTIAPAGVAAGAPASAAGAAAALCPAPCQSADRMDIDTDMPYGELEPFGRENTGQELTESSIKESDGMVDQLERAEVAEEKRAVFRALTRLRGAAITSFDGIARSQTGNIDEYNKVHQWRKVHPLNHLADEESDVTRWAFPDDADF